MGGNGIEKKHFRSSLVTSRLHFASVFDAENAYFHSAVLFLNWKCLYFCIFYVCRS